MMFLVRIIDLVVSAVGGRAAEAQRPSSVGTRIHIDRYTSRWDNDPVDLTEALDFWSAAAAAANVIMQLSMPGIGHGVVESRVESGALQLWVAACLFVFYEDTYQLRTINYTVLMADVRYRIRRNKSLI